MKDSPALCLLSLILASTCILGCATSKPSTTNQDYTPAPPAPLVETKHTGPLNLNEAIKRSIAYNQSIIDLRTQVDVSEQEELASHDHIDPELRLMYASGNSDEERDQLVPFTLATNNLRDVTGDDEAYRIGLRFFPQNPWTRSKQISEAKANHYALTADLRHAESLLANEVAALFAEVHYLRKDIEILNTLVMLKKDILDRVKHRSKQGQATLQEVMTISSSYLSIISERDRQMQLLEEANHSLGLLASVPSEDLNIKFDKNEFRIINLSALNADKLAKQALDNRSDLNALTWRTKAAKAAYEQARDTKIPWFNHIQLSYAASVNEDTLTYGSSDINTDQNHTEEWRIDAGINIPIFSWWNHEDDVCRVEYKRMQILQANHLSLIQKELNYALSAVQNTEKHLSNYKAESAPIVRDMEKVIADIENNTGINPDEAAKIREQIARSQRLNLKYIYQYRLSILKLEQISGVQLSQ